MHTDVTPVTILLSKGNFNCRHLDVTHNLMMRIPDGVLELQNLRVLKAAHNQIAVLPASIMKLSKLKELKLSNNQIIYIPEEICTLRRLQTLHLDCNKVISLPLGLSNLEKLIESNDLQLDENPLSCPPLEVCQLGLKVILYYQENGECPEGVLENARNEKAKQVKKVHFDTD